MVEVDISAPEASSNPENPKQQPLSRTPQQRGTWDIWKNTPYFRGDYSATPTRFDGPFDECVCIPLTQGRHALIDATDFDLLGNIFWHVYNGYMFARGLRYFHRLVLLTPRGLHTDHRNGNTLDNRRENLRICTNAQNQWNRKKQCNSKVASKGVYLHGSGKYTASIRVDGKLKHLGSFETENAAALAYNTAARFHRGDFARVNEVCHG